VRLAGLQQITHQLSVSMNVDDAVPGFLHEARLAFEATRAELWLSVDGPLRRIHQDIADGVDANHSVAVEHEWLERVLDESAGTGHHTTPYGGAAIVAPLRSGQRAYGALCLYDRVGMEGFEEGEVAVATALAAELVGFMERAKLVEAVLEERAKLAQIVEQTSDGIVTLSPDGRIRSWNRALEQITGYFSVEMAGTAHLAIIRPCDEHGHEIQLDRWVDIPDLPERIQIRTSSGETRWLSCSFTRAAGTTDQEETLIIVARDVTAAHELERLKDDFVAVVSHELRTPLVPIKGWASMLLSRGDRMTAEQRHDAIESIHTQAQRLERLVLNILDSSRIENGVDAAAINVDVSMVAGRVLEEMGPSANRHNVRLIGTGERHIAQGQPVWVERALANLIANALKYTPAGTDVTVSIEDEGNDVVVRVADEGPGIPDGWQDRIFERFERVPGSDTQTGTGLGLYITRQLVTAMGGTVELDPTAEVGTTFVMRLRTSAQLPSQRAPGDDPRSVTLH
jgi:PAS domain S-box-containing protein